MSRSKAKVSSVRQRVLAQIDVEIELAQDHVRLANDLTDLLNMIDDSEPRIEKRDNIITITKKEIQ